MLAFRKLELSDIGEIRPFFDYSNTQVCDDTVGGTFMWRNLFKTECTVWQQNLISKVKYFGGVTAFSMPLGEDPLAALGEIEQYCRASAIPMVLCTMTERDIALTKTRYRVAVRPEPDWGDYLYLASDLAAMSGKRYHGQRNHINYFMKTFSDYFVEPITSENLPDVRCFFDRYRAEIQKDSAIFRAEQEAVTEVLAHYEVYDLDGLALRVGGQIISFAFGGRQGDTVFVHAEKTDQRYRGANQMMAMQYAQRHLKDGAVYINREEDVGDPGLRASKLSYHPHKILEKFTVTILD